MSNEPLYSPIHGRRMQYNVQSNAIDLTKLNYSTKHLYYIYKNLQY